MKRKRVWLSGLAVAAIMTSVACMTHANNVGEPERDEEQTIKLADAPEAVRAAVARIAPAEAVKKVSKEEEDDVYTYEVDYTVGGTECSVTLSAAGDVLETEKAVSSEGLPAAAAAALKKSYADVKVGEAVVVEKRFYEIKITENGKTREIVVDASGKVTDRKHHHEEKDEHDEKDEKGEKK